MKSLKKIRRKLKKTYSLKPFNSQILGGYAKLFLYSNILFFASVIGIRSCKRDVIAYKIKLVDANKLI